MLKKLLILCLAMFLSMGVAFAAVEVNSADQAALESVKGLGPVKSKAIIDERAKNGPFKNADDLASRVRGLGVKSVSNLEQAGLTIGGSSAVPTGVKPATRSAPVPSVTTSRMPSTITTTPAATGATSPAATTETTPATRTRRAKAKKDDAATPGTATASVGTTAAPASPASTVKAKKASRKKKGAASDSAAK